MQLFSDNEQYKLYNGNMLDMLEVIEPNSIDSIITDPPYELNFMGKGWDNAGVSFQKETWEKCFQVLKSGGYLLAFGGSRTFHRIACAIEDAGFEIRDTIMWLYGSGFPKSMNIGLAIDKKNGVESEVISTGRSGATSRAYQSEEMTTSGDYEIKKANNEWNGWGTALKPSFEPIIIARKPFKGSLVDNIIENGVGGLNIDECRIQFEETKNPATNPLYRKEAGYKLPVKGLKSNGVVGFTSSKNEVNKLGRFPANTILTYDETDFDEVCGGFPYTNGGNYRKVARKRTGFKISGSENNIQEANSPDNYGDSGSASRYFYCAKASKKDRDEGLDSFETKRTSELQGGRKEGSAGSIMQNANGGSRVNPYAGTGTPKKNIHPTVKPTELMQYLVRLVTPENGIILDPFNGSGSTGKAVMYENKERNKNYKYIGIELTEEYLPISKARIDFVCNLKEEKETVKDYTIFDFIEEEK